MKNILIEINKRIEELRCKYRNTGEIQYEYRCRELVRFREQFMTSEQGIKIASKRGDGTDLT